MNFDFFKKIFENFENFEKFKILATLSQWFVVVLYMSELMYL